jgi:hypothetical protein
MNCVPNISADQAGGQSRVVVSLMTSETTIFSASTGDPAVTQSSIADDLQRRAENITVVLAEIMDYPTPIRHWGLNE